MGPIDPQTVCDLIEHDFDSWRETPEGGVLYHRLFALRVDFLNHRVNGFPVGIFGWRKICRSYRGSLARQVTGYLSAQIQKRLEDVDIGE